LPFGSDVLAEPGVVGLTFDYDTGIISGTLTEFVNGGLAFYFRGVNENGQGPHKMLIFETIN